jgi:gliding motility-associated peptidyl-prolyl isomerase
MLLLITASCKGPEARWPVEAKGGSFLKLSAQRNKQLLEREEAWLDAIIAADSSRTYQNSSSGSRFYYENRNTEEGYTPRPDDLVTLQYNILSWNNDTIYSRDEIGIIRYKVDKQELYPGLRNSVKLLQEGESAVFMFPSSLAYGYHGDQDRIGPNTPIKTQVWVLKIEKEQNTNTQ